MHASGFAVLKQGGLAAYLIGDMLIDHLWERSAWMCSAKCDRRCEAGVEVLSDMYAALGERWVGYGILDCLQQPGKLS